MLDLSFSASSSNVDPSHVVVDCLAVGQAVRGGTDERVILFVKLAEGASLSEDLQRRIKGEIRMQRSARHVPERVRSWRHRATPQRVVRALTEMLRR